MKNVHLNGLFQSSSLLYYFSKIPFGYSCFNGDVPANPPVDCFSSRILHYFKHSLKNHTKQWCFSKDFTSGQSMVAFHGFL